jgi:hypothetical protein
MRFIGVKFNRKQIKLKFSSLFLVIILVCSGSVVITSLTHDFSNATAVSTWTHETGKNFKNGTLDNLTVVGGGEDAELKINLSGLHTWTKLPQTNRPVGNYYHEMVSIWGTDKVMLFGGYGYYNTTWEFDLSDGTWAIKNTQKSPPARYWQGMAAVWGDDKVVLFGGQGTSTIFQDTWVYDSSDSTWTEMFPPTSLPYSTLNNNMATIWGTKKVFLFGGTNYNETWIYDLNLNTWTRKSPLSAPKPGWYHSLASIHGTDKVVLYGGNYNLLYYNETWVYDLDMDRWTNISTSNNPGPRSYSAMFPLYGTDKILLFGGWWSNNNDIWIFDYSKKNWVRKKSTNIVDYPVSGWYHTMAPFYKTDKAILFGGYYTYYMDDTWIYRHSSPTRNGTFTSNVYDTGSPSVFKSITWSGNVPANTSIRIQLRTAENETILVTKDYVGPDGDTTSYYTSPPTEIWSDHNGDRWIQCRIFFNINYFTEALRLDVLSITYNCIPNTLAIGPLDGILIANNKPLFLWTFSDHDSEVQNAFQVLIDDDIEFKSINYNSGVQNSTNNQWQFPAGTKYTKISEGTWYWKVHSKDDDGMWTEFTEPRSIIIDTKPPNSATNMPYNNGYYKYIDTIFGIAKDGEQGSGVKQVEISIRRQSDNTYWSGTMWVTFPTWLLTLGSNEWLYDTSTIPWTSGTRYIIHSRATDNATNIEPSDGDGGTVFTIDKDCPISGINTPQNNVWLNNLDTITGSSFDLSGSGLVKVEICINCTKDVNPWQGDDKVNSYWDGSKWSPEVTWLVTTGTQDWVFDPSSIPWSTGNEYLIRCRGTDSAGNLEISDEGVTFMYDAIPPEELTININNDDIFTDSNGVTLSIHADDFGSGVAQMAFSMDNNEWSEWIPFTNEKNFILPPIDGEKTVFFRVKDYVGNIAESVSDSIYLDTTPPEKLSIKINGNDKFTKSRNVRCTLSGVDSGSGIKDVTFSNNGLDWQAWEPFSATRYFIFSGEEGENIIYLKIRDNVGNVAEPVSDSIILDTTAPYSLMIVVNNGAFETNSTLVTLNLNAIDDISRVTEMSLSNDGVTWSSWENYTFLKYYNLPPGEGIKTIYFKVRDANGNEAKPVSTSITVISPKPVEEKKEASDIITFSSTEFWIILLIILTIILLAVNLVLILKRRKHPEGEVTALAPTIKPDMQFAPGSSIAQVPTTIKLDQLPGTGISGASAVPIPVLAKSTQVTPTPSPGKVPELPALPPARIQDEKPETISPAPGQVPTITPTTTTTLTPQSTTIQPQPQVQLPPQEPSQTIPQPQQPQIKQKEQSN